MMDKVQKLSNPATVSISSESVRTGKFIYFRIVALFSLAYRLKDIPS
jgi:hypothetical protein